MNPDRLTEEVLRRLETMPRALLIGEHPPEDGGFLYVREPPYGAVVIGRIPPGQLLQMPSDAVCRALMQGLPVWLWPQAYGKGKHAVLLRRELAEAERRLILFGVRPVPIGRWQEERKHDRRYGNRESLGHQKM